MFNSQLLRPDLSNLLDYTPVKPINVVAAELGLKDTPTDLVKLDANENVYPVHPNLLTAISKACRESIYLYPDPEQTKLVKAISDYHRGVRREQVVCGAGSDDLIDLIIRIVKPSRIFLPSPTFAMYKFFGLILGDCEIVQIPLLVNEDKFCLARNLLVEAILAAGSQERSILFLASPNNPTGNLIPKEVVRRLCDDFKHTNCLVVVDEAYVEFANTVVGGDVSSMSLVADCDNLVVIRTFSKWAGLAGLRAGYLVGHEDFVCRIKQIKIPYNLNICAESAAVACLTDEEVLSSLTRQMEVTILERCRIKHALSANFLVYDSDANFLLCKFKPPKEYKIRTSVELHDELKGMGILTRVYPNEPMIRDCIRISIARPEDSDCLLLALARLGLVYLPQISSFDKRPENRIILFDMDGVIANVSSSYRVAIKQTSSYFGVDDVSDADILKAKLRGNANNDWILTRKFILEGSTNKPSLAEQLLASARNVQLGIVTGRNRERCDYFLRKHDLAEYFQHVICMEDSSKAKPSPEPVLLCLRGILSRREYKDFIHKSLEGSQIIFIGDTVDDVFAGLAANVLPIAVLAPTKVDRDLPLAEVDALYAAGAFRSFATTSEMQDWLLSSSSFDASSNLYKKREASITRKTRETDIYCKVFLDGVGASEIETGIPFFNHLLEALAKHSRIDLKLCCLGDVQVDDHHSVEDVAIVIGSVLRLSLDACLDKQSVKRFDTAHALLDEALARCVLDLSGRGCCVFEQVPMGRDDRKDVGGLSLEMVPHFFESLSSNLRASIHLDLIRGSNAHHKAEATFKSFGLALGEAISLTSYQDVPSTKGVI